jgi:hypothetical protein
VEIMTQHFIKDGISFDILQRREIFGKTEVIACSDKGRFIFHERTGLDHGFDFVAVQEFYGSNPEPSCDAYQYTEAT